jgi:hypothetical protein
MRPEPQRKVFTLNIIDSSINLLLIISLSMLFYNTVKDNTMFIDSKYHHLFKYTVANTDQSLSMLTSIASLFVAKMALSRSIQPRVVYTADIATKGAHEWWCISLYNAGSGIALISDVSFEIVEHNKLSDSRETIEYIKSDTILPFKHFHLKNIGNGYAISPKDSFELFSIQVDKVDLDATKQIICHVKFKDQLKSKYIKTVYLFPITEWARAVILAHQTRGNGINPGEGPYPSK